MSLRSHSRSASQIRPLKITTKFIQTALGSALVEWGDTKIICTATIEDSVPGWMRGTRGQGWLTAEYSMIPGATQDRSRRERQSISGRTQEIQRFLSRSLRSIVDLKLVGERTITIDCDVIQADGGTRTASVIGGYVALKCAVDACIKHGRMKTNPLRDSLAAVSLGFIDEQPYVDLDFEENLNATSVGQFVMTASGEIVEVHLSSDKKPFSKEQLVKSVDLAARAIQEITEEQNSCLM